MRISLLLELPVPRPWGDKTEQLTFAQALDQLELADRLGFHGAWFTEHHFLEEYSHLSSPEIFVAALTQRTKRLRLGFGIKQMPATINHPARVAEQMATLDLLSNGRIEWGTGEASSVGELDGFGVDAGKKRLMWDEATRVAARCMAETPFSGFAGETLTMPPRNVVPKPLQKPYPPLWLACTRQATIDLASSRGMGALSFTLLEPEDFTSRVEQYYGGLADATPIGPAFNANIAAPVGDMVCAPSLAEAEERMGECEGFFGFGLMHYYSPDIQHRPGRTDLWAEFMQAKQTMAAQGAKAPPSPMVGTPVTIRESLLRWEGTGADEVMFIIPPIEHEAVMDSLKLFGAEVLPEFIDRDVTAQKAKAERMEPIAKAALARVVEPESLAESYTFGGVPVSHDKQHRASEIADVLAAWQSAAADA